MNEPVPSRPKSAVAAKDTSLSRAAQVESSRSQVLVRFYRRMKLRRVYPLVVGLQQRLSASGTAFAVRPLVPGALVTPGELIMDPAKAGTQATFYVTPLARGRLPHARVQLHRQGNLLQEIALPMKAVTQRLTWILLALTILVPAFLLYTTKYHPLTGTVPREMRAAPEQPKNGQAGDKKPGLVGGLVRRFVLGGLPPVAPAPVIKHIQASPGEMLEYNVRKGLQEDVPFVPPSVADPVAHGLGTAYGYACAMAEAQLSFYVGALLLALTIWSAITHSSRRARRRTALLPSASV